MMLMYLFLLFVSIFTSAAEIDEDWQHGRNFRAMQEHIAQCPVECTDLACAQKDKTIHADYKRLYKDVYCTYHCLSEINAKQHRLDQNYRYFINYFGEMVLCKKDAKAKNELVLYRRSKNANNYRLKRSHKDKQLNSLRTPVFTLVRAANNDANYEKVCRDEVLYTELMCCAKECPTEVIDIICDYDRKIGHKLYLYYFLDTREIEYRHDKKFLFCNIDFTNSHVMKKYIQTQEELDKCNEKLENEKQITAFQLYCFPTLDYEYFLVDHQFNIAMLHTDVDIYSNGDKRIAMICEYEEQPGLFSESKKCTSLFHIPQREEQLRCKRCGEGKMFVCKYIIDDIEKQHQTLARAELSGISFYCDHAQLITGSEKEIRDYFTVALKRIELGTTCLVKNDAASSHDREVYNNPFGEFVVKRNGKYLILPGYMDNSNLYYAVHNNEDVLDDTKMQQRAQLFAQRWQKTYDGRFLYCWEENLQGTCAKTWPYGEECSWEGDHSYRYWYNNISDIELCDGGLESFSKWRLWILPLYPSCIFVDRNRLLFHDTVIYFCMMYADWPYEITHIDEDMLTLEYDKSDYRVSLDLSRRDAGLGLKGFQTIVRINFEGHAPHGYERGNINILYTYKDPAKLEEFHQRKQERNEQKKREEQIKKQAEEDEWKKKRKLEKQEERIKMGLAPATSMHSHEQLQNKKKDSSIIASLHNNVPKIVGGLAIGAVVAGAAWFLHKHNLPDSKLSDSKLPNPTT